MRRCLILYGVTCIVGQLLALREIAVAFHGNELLFGTALGVWLLLFALGSGLLGRLARAWNAGPAAFTLGLCGAGILLPVTILLVRVMRRVIAGESGVALSFGAVLLTTAAALVPLCLLLGFFYSLACSVARKMGATSVRPAAWVYVFEAAGTFIGGVVFTYLLIPIFDGFEIALFVAALDCLAAFSIWWYGRGTTKQKWGWSMLAAALLLATMFLSPLGAIADFASQTLRYPHSTLTHSEDTPYGRIDVVTSESQTEFYESGALAGASHMDRRAEEQVLPALLSHPLPKRVLVIGGSASGVLRKALLLPWLAVDFIELDPALIGAARLHADLPDRRALDSQHVTILSETDARAYLRGVRGRYDVILSAVPNPDTGLANRFYTAEFFSDARKALTGDGILALSLDGSPAYMSEPHRVLAASVLRTLQSKFGSIATLCGDGALYFLATPPRQVRLADAGAWEQRMAAWHVEPTSLPAAALRDMADPARTGRVSASLAAVKLQSLNEDLRPVAYYHALMLWAESLQLTGSPVMAVLLGTDIWDALLLIGVCVALMAAWLTFATRPRKAGVASAMFCTGAAGFMLQMVLVFAFQSLCGSAYGQLGVLFAAFMAGLTVGAAWSARLTDLPETAGCLMLLQIALALLAVLTVPCLYLIDGARGALVQWGGWIGIPALNLAVGFAVGAQFPIAVGLYSRGRKDDAAADASGSTLYAMDMAGACAGAWLTGTLLIPVLGIAGTCMAVSLLAVAGVPLLMLSSRRD